MAVAETGMQVIVIGMKSTLGKPEFYCDESLDMIQYWNFNKSKSGSRNYLHVYFYYKKHYRDALDYFGTDKDDYIIVYSTELDTVKAALEYSLVPDEHKAFCEVEWFQPYQYRNGIFNPLYILWKIGFHYRMKNFQKAIPISENLERLFIRKGCKTLVVPPLADTDNVRKKSELDNKYVNFIYPGSASDKDSFPCMIKAFQMIEPEKKKRVRFHLTGSMSYEKLSKILKKDGLIMEDLNDILVFHNWLDYDELMALYTNVDYLLIARAKTRVTLSNFPSKVPEMMSYGIVPVCSDVGDYTRKYLHDGIDSIQFESDSVLGCAAAIKKAIEIKESTNFIKMQAAARETAIEKLDYRNWGKQIVDFLQSGCGALR